MRTSLFLSYRLIGRAFVPFGYVVSVRCRLGLSRKLDFSTRNVSIYEFVSASAILLLSSLHASASITGMSTFPLPYDTRKTYWHRLGAKESTMDFLFAQQEKFRFLLRLRYLSYLCVTD